MVQRKGNDNYRNMDCGLTKTETCSGVIDGSYSTFGPMIVLESKVNKI